MFSEADEKGGLLGSSRRIVSAMNLYHVVSRGVGKQIIFEDDKDRNAFLDLLFELLEASNGTLLAWCLMDNHFHLLLMMEMGELSDLMQMLNSKYAMYFNTRYGRVGHVFQGRFISEPVESESYLLTVVRYIHRNPEQALLCSIQEYAWSSYADYLNNRGATERDMVMALFGDVEEFERFHDVEDSSAPCIDVFRERRLLDEDVALQVARMVASPISVENIKGLERCERNEMISRLRRANLSIRQIERITGISRGIIASVAP